jgi:hypothetical protein
VQVAERGEAVLADPSVVVWSAVIPLIPVNRATRRFAAGDSRNSNHFGVDEPLHLAIVTKAGPA